MSQRVRDSLGPSIIIAAAVVGTGELIVAPRLGATVGLTALWLIVLGCSVKVLLQEEMGRHTILTGDSTLEAFNRVPGPKWKLSWASWTWLLMLVAGTVQMGGILAGLVQTLKLLHLPGHHLLLAGIVAAGTTAMLIRGRYKFIEGASGIMVAGFTVVTIIALVLLYWSEYAVPFSEIARGFTFRIPEAGFADAVAVFGITGIGTSELLFYSYWCLEKGYASDLRKDTPRDMNVVRTRVRGMRIDIAIAFAIYTFSTIAFFVLGATILHAEQTVPQGFDMILTLSQMYTSIFGDWVFYLFVLSAFVVLFSTFFVAMATWARLTADTLRLLAPNPERFNLRRSTKITLIVLGISYFLLCAFFSRTPQWLIVGGAVVQTLTLPIFGLAILLIRKKRQDPFRPGLWYDVLLYATWVIIAVAAIYSLVRMFS